MSLAQSPPRSQEENDLVMTDATPPSQSASREIDGPVSQRSLDPNTSSSQLDANGLNDKSNSKTGHGEPGSAWMSRKFAEEYERVYTQLLDQQFSTAQYEDPLLK